jgi:hypothetical protein
MGVYLQLTEDDRGQNFQGIWKAKIPLKIKIFMWMVAQKAILTKDNMVARNWQGDQAATFMNIYIISYFIVLWLK